MRTKEMNCFFAMVLGFFTFLFSSCVQMKYCNFIEINAPTEEVFAVLEDYENYPSFIPEFHKSVQIISEEKRGKGVVFQNFSTWNNYKMKSKYEITEYEENAFIKMKNLTQYGFTEMRLEKISGNNTKYTLTNELSIPWSMKEKLFSSFDKELVLVKDYCEKSKY